MKNRFSRFLAGMLAVLTVLCAVPTARAAGFADVPADSWAAEAIYRGVELGLFQGQSTGRFGMGQPMTRGAFVVSLCRLFGWELVTPSTPTYQDVQDPDAWYYSAVETAYAHGAITDQTDTFRPGDPITREEANSTVGDKLEDACRRILQTDDQTLCDRLRGGHNAGMVSRAEKFHRYRSFLPKGPSLGLVVRQRPRAVFCLFPPALPAISRKKHPL